APPTVKASAPRPAPFTKARRSMAFMAILPRPPPIGSGYRCGHGLRKVNAKAGGESRAIEGRCPGGQSSMTRGAAVCGSSTIMQVPQRIFVHRGRAESQCVVLHASSASLVLDLVKAFLRVPQAQIHVMPERSAFVPTHPLR